MASERDIRRGLSALARRYGLMDDMVSRLGRLHELLVHDPLASTSIRDPKDVLDEHLADSLAGLEVEALRGAERIADLGSGAGLPALPLAITLPRKRFVLIESSARKCMFLSGAALACAL